MSQIEYKFHFVWNTGNRMTKMTRETRKLYNTMYFRGTTLFNVYPYLATQSFHPLQYTNQVEICKATLEIRIEAPL